MGKILLVWQMILEKKRKLASNIAEAAAYGNSRRQKFCMATKHSVTL